MANLHRAGVGTQQVTTFYIESVVHRARGVVFRRVQRGEVKPVVFDFRATSHFKTHATENAFDALGGQSDGVQTACATLAARQGHV